MKLKRFFFPPLFTSQYKFLFPCHLFLYLVCLHFSKKLNTICIVRINPVPLTFCCYWYAFSFNKYSFLKKSNNLLKEQQVPCVKNAFISFLRYLKFKSVSLKSYSSVMRRSWVRWLNTKVILTWVYSLTSLITSRDCHRVVF